MGQRGTEHPHQRIAAPVRHHDKVIAVLRLQLFKLLNGIFRRYRHTFESEVTERLAAIFAEGKRRASGCPVGESVAQGHMHYRNV